MARITLKTGGNANISLGEAASQRDIGMKSANAPKYVGARAEVTKTENGVVIWMKDYKGETTETIAEAIDSITTNDDGSLTFTLPNGDTITTGSLKGDKGDTGDTGNTGATGNGIASIEKTGTSGLVDTYTVTYTNGDTDTFTVTNGADGHVTDVKVNGTSVLNGAVAEVSVPTTTSDLTNNSLYARGHVAAFHGTCDTAAGTAEKAVTCADFTAADLVAGAMIVVDFANANSAAVADLKLNVNNTGAYAIKQNGSGTLSNMGDKSYLKAASYPFIFNGSYWVTWYDTNSNTIGYTIRTNGLQIPVKTACYRYRICFTSPDGKSLIPANASTSTSATASKTVTTEKIDPFGRIIYYSYSTAISAGGSIGTAYQMQQYNGVTLGYSFNRTGAALTMTAKKPVYVKCAPQTDGSAIIDSSTPFVQDLPTTEDGKIYIFLGVATSETAIEFTLEHPVYFYKNGGIRQWTNVDIPSKVSDLVNDYNYVSYIDLADNYFKELVILNVSGSSAALLNSNGNPILMAHFANSCGSVVGVQIAQVINTSGDDYDVRFYDIVRLDMITSFVRLISIDNGTIYTADLQDAGSGLTGTISTATI